MFFSDQDIKSARESGDLVIEPFCEQNLQAASYDITLASDIKIPQATGLSYGEQLKHHWNRRAGDGPLKLGAEGAFDPHYGGLGRSRLGWGVDVGTAQLRSRASAAVTWGAHWSACLWRNIHRLGQALSWAILGGEGCGVGEVGGAG